MQVSVIIPVYNVLPLAKECLASILSIGSKLMFEVIVVDNGSAPEVEAWLLDEEKSHPNLRHLRFAQPLGFAGAANAGASVATGDVLIVLNSDSVVTPGWMDGLYLALSSDETLGVVAPYSNQAGAPELMDFRTIDLPLSKALALVSTKPLPARIRYLPQRITFFCFAIRREVWQELGGLNEAYRVGNFEDDHMCLRLRVAGFRLGIAEHVFVYHRGKATFHGNALEHNKWLTQNAAIFAGHSRDFALASDTPMPRWPKRSASDISVVILAKPGAPLDRTLQSLRNQTVRDFEILLPRSGGTPAGNWIAYLTEGDIFYPFHLESLQDAMQRGSRKAVFSDGWVLGETRVFPHPDFERSYKELPISNPLSPHAPTMLAGWMHHQSLDPRRLWQQTAPLRWPYLTWEMFEGPAPRTAELSRPVEETRSLSLKKVVIESARCLYRHTVPYEVRLSIDARARSVLHMQSSSFSEGSSLHETPMRDLTRRLSMVIDSRTDAGKFSSLSSPPDVIFFNIIRWESLFQRPHHFAVGLAERGHRVFWIEPWLRSDPDWWSGRPFEQVRPGVHVLQLPGPGEQPAGSYVYQVSWDQMVLEAMSSALAQTASSYGVQRAVSLVHFPRWEPLVARARTQFGWKFIYDCLDDHGAFARLYRIQLGDHEDRLIDEADGLISSSAQLQRRMFGQRSSVVVPNAADYELFSSSTAAGYLRHLPRPIVGFFGALADWLDMEVIRFAATQLPDWSFVYIGESAFSGPKAQARWTKSTAAPNITVLPKMDPCTLAVFLAEFDVCTMPFVDEPVTQCMNAVKIYEYLAAGKPVISHDLPEIRQILAGEAHPEDLIALYSTPREFVSRLRACAAADNPVLVRHRKDFARRHDWSHRVDLLEREIQRVAEGVPHATGSSSVPSGGSKARF